MKFAILFAAFVISRCYAQDQLAATLHKAVIEEDVNHNLDAAIKGYQSVVQQYQDDRGTAATALYRLAECYRKLGKTAEADAAFRQLQTQFPDQTVLTERSRRQITQPTSEQRLERKILQEKLDISMQQLSDAKKKIDLGMIDTSDLPSYQLNILRAQNDLLAFDAAKATGTAADNLRRQRRAITDQAIGLIEQLIAKEEKKVQLGVISPLEVSRKKAELLEVEQQFLRK